MHFNVCVIKPRGFIFAYAFLELAELLAYSLRDLGYKCFLTIDDGESVKDLDPAMRNIIIGCHLLPPSEIPRVPDSTIIINTEQIYSVDRWGWNKNLFAWIKQFETWDYSPKNVATFHELELSGVKLLKIGHQPELARITKSDDQDIDVLFYGALGPRRIALLDELRARALNVVCLNGSFGTARDEYISRSKIVLNTHYHAAEIFEIVRVHYLLSNAVAVVSEVNPTTSIPAMYKQAIFGASYESLADECARLVCDDGALAELRSRGLTVISQYPQAEFTKDALG